MRYAAREPVYSRREQFDEFRVGVPLVKENRFLNTLGEFELADECLALRRDGRKIAEVVEPALTDGYDVRIVQQRGKPGLDVTGLGGGIAHTDREMGSGPRRALLVFQLRSVLRNYTEKDEPQPQVVAAFGLRITNCAP